MRPAVWWWVVVVPLASRQGNEKECEWGILASTLPLHNPVSSQFIPPRGPYNNSLRDPSSSFRQTRQTPCNRLYRQEYFIAPMDWRHYMYHYPFLLFLLFSSDNLPKNCVCFLRICSGSSWSQLHKIIIACSVHMSELKICLIYLNFCLVLC